MKKIAIALSIATLFVACKKEKEIYFNKWIKNG